LLTKTFSLELAMNYRNVSRLAQFSC